LSFEEAELLRRRAHSFPRLAERPVEEGEYDLAMFSLEQYCQLILEYRILVVEGSYPRTRSLRRLIRELGEHDPRMLELVSDIGKLYYIARLEEACIVSRYLPITYEEGEVREILRFVEEAFKPLVEGSQPPRGA